MLDVRPIATPEDYVATLRLVERVVGAAGPRANLNQAEFEYDWHAYYEPDEERLAALWVLDDEPAGCLLVTERMALVATLPGREEIEDEMFAWAEERLLPGGPCLTMAFEGDARRTSLLQRRGYDKMNLGENILARRLDVPPQPAPLPSGYLLRALTPGDIPARAALYGRAFSHDLTPERLRAVTGALGYRSDLDLIVAAPDGAPVAFATVWYDPVNHLGIFEPVGCDPDHQRRGLARALMVEGLRRLHARGARRVQVKVGIQEQPANRLYETTGFQLIDQRFIWRLKR